jgi:crotonobetainyl-CoA:carnitine CoA-transferase CaiB-like acyl-CoA transferase
VREALRNERGMIESVRHPLLGMLPMVRFPDVFPVGRRGANLAPPLLGQHTEEVLRKLAR